MRGQSSHNQQLGSWVRQQLQNVPLFDENDEIMKARIAEVMALEERDRKKGTVRLAKAYFKAKAA